MNCSALLQSFENFVNLNLRSPEYISLFMDDKLRRGLKVPLGCGLDICAAGPVGCKSSALMTRADRCTHAGESCRA